MKFQTENDQIRSRKRAENRWKSIAHQIPKLTMNVGSPASQLGFGGAERRFGAGNRCKFGLNTEREGKIEGA